MAREASAGLEVALGASLAHGPADSESPRRDRGGGRPIASTKHGANGTVRAAPLLPPAAPGARCGACFDCRPTTESTAPSPVRTRPAIASERLTNRSRRLRELF